MKVIVNIATKGTRPKQLLRAVNSLAGQCDQVNIYDNSKNEEDYTDLAKFYFLQFQKEPVYYLTADDDILYPPDYVETMKTFIDLYQCIITFHGRVLKDHAKGYYSGHDVYDFKLEQKKPIIVDVGGTGVMGFRTDIFNPAQIYKEPYKCMSDLVFSLEAMMNDEPIVCARRPPHWFSQMIVKDSIMKTERLGLQENQRKLVQLIKDIRD